MSGKRLNLANEYFRLHCTNCLLNIFKSNVHKVAARYIHKRGNHSIGQPLGAEPACHLIGRPRTNSSEHGVIYEFSKTNSGEEDVYFAFRITSSESGFNRERSVATRTSFTLPNSTLPRWTRTENKKASSQILGDEKKSDGMGTVLLVVAIILQHFLFREASIATTYTWKEVAKHNVKDDMWVVIENKV
jgi:hypothetical protein